MEPLYFLILCLALWGLFDVGSRMWDMVRPLLAPWIVLWAFLKGCWGWYKWAKGKVKAWKRKPPFDADFASLEVLKKAGYIDGDGFVLGKLEGKLVTTRGESRLIMFGAVGSGKSLLQAATLRRMDGDVFAIYDPKGEHFRQFNNPAYRVIRVNIDNPLDGEPYQPTSFFQNSDRYSRNGDYETLARLIFGPTEGGETSTHFAETSINLITGVLAHLDDLAGCTIADVAEILCVGGPDKRLAAFARMKGATVNPSIRMAVNAFEEAGERERGSIATTMSRKLMPWVNPRFVDLCRGSTWTWEDVLTGGTPTAVFLTGGLGDKEVNESFIRVFIGLGVQTSFRMYNRTGQAFPRPVKFIVDEADLLGGCIPVMNAITQLRSAGVSVFLAYQSPNQLKRNFGKMADTVLSNCDIVYSGGLKAASDLKEISALLGSKTVSTQSKADRGVSENEREAPLMSADAIFRLERFKYLAVIDNKAVKLDGPFEHKNGRPLTDEHGRVKY